jgi:hypothetical protein
LTLGKTIEDAFNKIETVERCAHILFIAEQIGPVKELSSREVERFLKQAGRLYVKEDFPRESAAPAEGQVKALKAEAPAASVEKKTGAAGYR